MKLSVIVLNYNVSPFLELCLHSVQKAIHNLDAEVIVVDNNSPDDSVAMVKHYFPEMHLIANKENLGFSKAYNQAVLKAKGEYVCVLNPDTVVQEDTFVNTLHKAETLPDLGIMGVQLIDGRGRFLPESKRNLPTTKVSFFKIFGRRFSKMAPYYAEHINRDGEGVIEILVGAFMLLKKSVYLKAKGFDERYFMYGEDIDFSYSIQQLGFKNYYLGSEKVVHFKGESTVKDKVYRERFYGAMKLFYKKYFRYTWFTDIVISGGIKLSSFLSATKKEELVREYTNGRFLGTSEGVKEKLSSSFSREFVEVVGDKQMNFLDTRSMPYRSLVKELSSNSNNGYRFVLPFTDKYLGSDTSNGRGEVVSF